jgi:hypothetical protein
MEALWKRYGSVAVKTTTEKLGLFSSILGPLAEKLLQIEDFELGSKPPVSQSQVDPRAGDPLKRDQVVPRTPSGNRRQVHVRPILGPL